MLATTSIQKRIVTLGLAAVVVSSVGCRSGMPSLNMWGFKREPSAEALAGSGPTSTYPVPPSATAKPQAIESVAAGVAPPQTSPSGTSNVAQASPTTDPLSGFGVDMGTPETKTTASAAPTNLAAAQANGFFGGAAPATSAPSHMSATTSGKAPAAAPKMATTAGLGMPTGPTGSPASSYTLPSLASNAPVADPPSAAFTPPVAQTTPTAASGPVAGGYSLPPGIGASLTSTPTTTASTSTLPMSASPASTVPSEVAPAGPEATIANAGGIPSASTAVLPASTTAPSGVYAPGSTSGTSAYPSGGYSPANNTGSIFR